jgi:hypothetical protein
MAGNFASALGEKAQNVTGYHPYPQLTRNGLETFQSVD